MSCPICGDSRAWLLPYHRDEAVEAFRRKSGDDGDYSWRLCCRCANAYPSRSPSPEVLDQIWHSSRDLEALGPAANAEAIWFDRIRMSRLWASRTYSMLVSEHSGPPGRFLDLACGFGETVKIFQDHGWEATGIDIDASTKPFHENVRIETQIGRVEDIAIDGKFDVVHIAHAIYFMSDVMGLLQKIRAHLAPGGVFVIWISDFLSSSDPVYPSYVHTFYPTKNSMRYALAIAGFVSSPPRLRSGSIFISARPGRAELPHVRPRLIKLAYDTKALRYRVFGRPNLLMRQIAKKIVNVARRRSGASAVI